ncbi:MAG: 50S ribosomal protein L11 methyltransferase, partial [Prevotella micans]|nr:50S ribosomal protein L11 methyltransferase [Prevotella micans]
MKYLQIEFRIEPYSQTSKDLTAAIAGSVGFDSFNDEESTLIGYCQESLFDKDKLDEALNEFPIEDTTITYNIEKVGDENWNSEWEKIGFSPIVI